MRVLVADDVPELRALLTHLLEGRGWRVTAVGCGASLVAAWRADPHDLVVSDVDMPGLCGLAAAAELGGVPFVLASGGWTAERRARAAALGAVVLDKPFTGDALLAAVGRAATA